MVRRASRGSKGATVSARGSKGASVPPKQVIVEVDEITLDGEKVQVRNQDIDVDLVQLDPTNPRVANTIQLGEAPKRGSDLQPYLEQMLWDDPDVHDLYRQVRANGGLIERIIVRKNMVVAEGNCRTVVYRRLRGNFPEDPNWKKIPARVLPDHITERQVAILLGEMHVTGKNEWKPFEKAGHLHKMFTQIGLTQEEIAQRLRMSKSAVNHNIRAFEVMKEKFLSKYGGIGAVRKFSYFLELFKKPELREWARANPKHIDEFVDWVGEDRFGRGEDIRLLRDVVTNEEALTAFREKGESAARQILERDSPERTSPLFKQLVATIDSLEGARVDDINRVRDGPASVRRMIRTLKESLDRFIDLCGGVD
jgi:hypothetical protein